MARAAVALTAGVTTDADRDAAGHLHYLASTLGTTAVTADAPWCGRLPEGDAVVTGQTRVICGILTADCAPMLTVLPPTLMLLLVSAVRSCGKVSPAAISLLRST